MSKYSTNNKISAETKEDALKIARGAQRPGQTKEQTRLIAQGIQKGIDFYKKQQKSKARELDKKIKKAKASQLSDESSTNFPVNPDPVKSNKLAWLLLITSWLGFFVYGLISKYIQI